jgi:hypothetical protein
VQYPLSLRVMRLQRVPFLVLPRHWQDFALALLGEGAFFRDDDVDEDDDEVSILYLLPSGSLNVAFTRTSLWPSSRRRFA